MESTWLQIGAGNVKAMYVNDEKQEKNALVKVCKKSD
jgi:hypothetical protein